MPRGTVARFFAAAPAVLAAFREERGPVFPAGAAAAVDRGAAFRFGSLSIVMVDDRFVGIVLDAHHSHGGHGPLVVMARPRGARWR